MVSLIFNSLHCAAAAEKYGLQTPSMFARLLHFNSCFTCNRVPIIPTMSSHLDSAYLEKLKKAEEWEMKNDSYRRARDRMYDNLGHDASEAMRWEGIMIERGKEAFEKMREANGHI